MMYDFLNNFRENNTKLDIHILQTFGANNMNTNEAGQPKTLTFGGKTRAYVSSQAWKRVTRKYAENKYKGMWASKRTQAIGNMVADIIAEMDPEIADPFALAEEAFGKCKINFTDLKKCKTAERGPKALFYLSLAQANAVAKKAVEMHYWKKAFKDLLCDENGETYSEPQLDGIKAALKSMKKGSEAITNAFALAGVQINEKGGKKSDCPLSNDNLEKVAAKIDEADAFSEKSFQNAVNSGLSYDIILFGRMYAENPNLDVDACCAVAPAFTTHTTKIEYDTFTAIDDCQSNESKGAAMLNNTPFTSGTYYRFATLDIDELAEHFSAEDVGCIAAEFIDAFAHSIPEGKIHKYANYVDPDLIYIVVRSDRPKNFEKAFDKPVVAEDGAYRLACEKALADFAKIKNEAPNEPPIFSVCFDEQMDGPDIAEKASFPDVLNKTANFIYNHLFQNKNH